VEDYYLLQALESFDKALRDACADEDNPGRTRSAYRNDAQEPRHARRAAAVRAGDVRARQKAWQAERARSGLSRGDAQRGTAFEAALMEKPEVEQVLASKALSALFDPTTYVGLAPAIVDRVLAETRASGWLET
jgi:adenylosuccinate lyase